MTSLPCRKRGGERRVGGPGALPRSDMRGGLRHRVTILTKNRNGAIYTNVRECPVLSLFFLRGSSLDFVKMRRYATFLMPHRGEHDENLERIIDDYIDTRWGQLVKLEKEWGERALQYLLLVNSGGAVATLGFIGAAPANVELKTAGWALAFFVTGLILVGFATARTYYYIDNLAGGWMKDVNSYNKGELTWEELTSNDEKRAESRRGLRALPWSSFACFIIGCILGAIALLR